MRTGWIALKNEIQFKKSVKNGAFEKSAQIFAQLKGVGEVTARRLFSSFESFEGLMRADPQAVAQVSGHQPKWVNDLLDLIHRDIPLYQAVVSQLGYTPLTNCARVQVNFALLTLREEAPKLRRPDQHLAHLIVGSLKKELFFYRRITASQLPFEATIDVPLGTQLKAYIVDDKIGQWNDCKQRRKGVIIQFESHSLVCVLCACVSVGADAYNVAYLRYGTNINAQLDSSEVSD